MSKKYISFFMLGLIMTFGLSACGETSEDQADLLDAAETADQEMGYESEDDASDQRSEDDQAVSETEAEDLTGAWTLNAEESTLTYSASKIVGNSHTGTVDIKQGSLTADETGITGGEFVMDMTTITESENSEMYLNHVKGDDFFAVDAYPEARFVMSAATLKESTEAGDVYQVTGDLTIRDITNEITFEATANGDANILSITADFAIDRTRWDINFDSGSVFTDLGDKAIKDEIQFNLDLMFEIQE